jgi:hypothetical protein
MKATSRNLWSVRMQHMSYESLLILAPSAEQAARKAIVFTRKEDGLARPVVKEVKFSGAIDKF